MKMFIRQQIDSGDVADEFVTSAFAYLDAAERLNEQMSSGSWGSDYRNAQVILWLTFHSAELLLKGCIAKTDPTISTLGHVLPMLRDRLEAQIGKFDLELPFGVEGSDGTPEIEHLVRNHARTTHERLRYPTDQKGLPWPGLEGFSPQLFAGTLKNFKKEAEALRSRLFTSAT